MMEPSIKASWWMWWGNPLVQIHPDKKRLFYVESKNPEDIEYSAIESLRATLGLQLIPEPGIITAPSYGILVMVEPQDLLESQQKIPALTFDDSVFKLSSSEWDQQFQIRNKDHIRALITFSRSMPDELQLLAKRISATCASLSGENGLSLSLHERTQIVLSLFFACRFPEFNRRWLLGLSDAVMQVIAQIGDVDPELGRRFCSFIDSEVQALIAQITQRYVVPELDFKTLADYESEV